MNGVNGGTYNEIVLHHLDDSRSQRILWLLEELGVPYTIQRYKRLSDGAAPREFKDVYPLSKGPVIVDGFNTIGESGAIVEYLIRKYGKGHFQPAKEWELTNSFYTHFAEGTLIPYLAIYLTMMSIITKVSILLRWIFRPLMDWLVTIFVAPNVKEAADMIESDLEKSHSGWFAGGIEPTSADFMMLFPMEMLPDILYNRWAPYRKAWLDKVYSRPAYRRAWEKGCK